MARKYIFAHFLGLKVFLLKIFWQFPFFFFSIFVIL